MPKREVTPPPPEDEPRYLTVVYPYPPQANMELVQDCAEFSRWIACVVGKDVLLALFHKPSVRATAFSYYLGSLTLQRHPVPEHDYHRSGQIIHWLEHPPGGAPMV